SGMPRRDVAERMIAFLVLMYGVYMVALIVCGFGLRWGIFNGPAPYGVTVVPAYIAMIAIVLFFALAFLPANLGRRLGKSGKPTSKLGRLGRLIAFGVDPGLAVVAVLVYRGFAFWLPTLPGAIAYLQLRRTVARWREERAAGRRAAETSAPVTI